MDPSRIDPILTTPPIDVLDFDGTYDHTDEYFMDPLRLEGQRASALYFERLTLLLDTGEELRNHVTVTAMRRAAAGRQMFARATTLRATYNEDSDSFSGVLTPGQWAMTVDDPAATFAEFMRAWEYDLAMPTAVRSVDSTMLTAFVSDTPFLVPLNMTDVDRLIRSGTVNQYIAQAGESAWSGLARALEPEDGPLGGLTLALQGTPGTHAVPPSGRLHDLLQLAREVASMDEPEYIDKKKRPIGGLRVVATGTYGAPGPFTIGTRKED